MEPRRSRQAEKGGPWAGTRQLGGDSAASADWVLRGRGLVSARAVSLLLARGLVYSRIAQSDPEILAELLLMLLSVAGCGLAGCLA